VLVVATTGGQPIESIKLVQYPTNARIERFIRITIFCDVMVTNGGYNGVQAVCGEWLPLVAAGQTEDKPEYVYSD